MAKELSQHSQWRAWYYRDNFDDDDDDDDDKDDKDDKVYICRKNMKSNFSVDTKN